MTYPSTNCCFSCINIPLPCTEILRDEDCYQGPHLCKFVLFSWGYTRHLVIGDVEEPKNWTEPITGHDGRIEWDMKNVRRWPVHPVLRWFVYAHSNEKCHKCHHFGNAGWMPGDLLIRIWVYCLLRITISLVDEHPTQVDNNTAWRTLLPTVWQSRRWGQDFQWTA